MVTCDYAPGTAAPVTAAQELPSAQAPTAEPDPELVDRSAAVSAPASVEAAPAALARPSPPDILDGIVIAPESHADTYARKDWPHWRDADKDCQDARDEALIAESTQTVVFKTDRGCDVATGHWVCPYTGLVFEVAGKLDVDHLVPLRNAHVSGAWTWDRDRRMAYANDLSNPSHLIAVQASANRKKGAKGPDEWLPRLNKCRYVREWAQVKRTWELTMTEAEASVVRDIGSRCDDG
jgi:hypothetical protein